MSIPIFYFNPPALTAFPPALADCARVFTHLSPAPLTAKVLAQTRQCLWHALPLTLQTALTECQCAHILSIHSHQALWQQLPWELLAEPTASRYVTRTLNTLPSTLPLNTVPVHCLWLGFSPLAGQHRLALEHEQQMLKYLFAPLRAQVQLHSPLIHTVAELKAYYAQQSWDVVIISGHGATAAQDMPQLALLLSQGHWLTGQQLAQCLQSQPPRLLVLNTCLSAVVNSPQHSILAALLTIGIPHIIGMQGRVLDRAGLKFIQALLIALWQALPIAQAVHMGRIAMQQLLAANECWREAQDPSFGQWALPVLYSATPQQALMPIALPMQTTAQLAAAPPLLIGRRVLLQNLLSILTAPTVQGVFLYGTAGCGKTALAHALQAELAMLGFSVQPLTQTAQIEAEPNTLYYADDFPQTRSLPNTPLRCLLIARRLPPDLPDFIQAQMVPLASYEAFLGYAQHLGLPHPELQIRLMFRVWRARFRGLEIIRSLPVCTGKAFVQQVDQVGRCIKPTFRT